jgi:3'-phosphoadenosine 5'-phosphosulfate sulfotransferase (PAPS reductase)/FAD synthetase
MLYDLIDRIEQRPADPFEDAKKTLKEAVAEYEPTHIFALFSGGHDSVCAAHVAKEVLGNKLTANVHCNTTIGIQKTRDYAENLSRAWGVRHLTYFPPRTYREIVLDYGFPGPAQHRAMYIQLKERCVDALIRDHKVNRLDRIMLITGVRKAESVRRMGSVQRVSRTGAKVWVAPLINWEDGDKHAYIKANNIPYNEVALQLCMSGECLCGAYANPGELAEIDEVAPESAAEIRTLMAEVRAAGKHWRWGTAPPKNMYPDADQTNLDLHLCHSCEAKQEAP